MGFSYRWINWIKECISSASFSIILNGSPAGNFRSNRGIRQGDPLSPYLFVMAMEFWSVSIDIAIASGKIKPFRRNDNLLVSHLLFADDMLVFCRADPLSAKGINKTLQELQLYTGLSVNKQKKQIIFQ